MRLSLEAQISLPAVSARRRMRDTVASKTDERERSVDTSEQATEGIGQKEPINHDELVSQIIDTIVTEGMIDRERVTPDATIESLDLKSIDIVMILTALEDKFDVYIPMDGPFHDAKDVKSLIDAIASYISKEKQQA